MTAMARLRLAGEHLFAGVWVLLNPSRIASELRGVAESVHAGGRSIRTPASGVPALETVLQLDGGLHTLVDQCLFQRFATEAQRAALLREHQEAIAATRLALERMLKAARLGPYMAGAMLAGSEAALLRPAGLYGGWFHAGARALLLLLPPLVLLGARYLVPPLLRRALHRTRAEARLL